MMENYKHHSEQQCITVLFDHVLEEDGSSTGPMIRIKRRLGH